MNSVLLDAPMSPMTMTRHRLQNNDRRVDLAGTATIETAGSAGNTSGNALMNFAARGAQQRCREPRRGHPNLHLPNRFGVPPPTATAEPVPQSTTPTAPCATK